MHEGRRGIALARRRAAASRRTPSRCRRRTERVADAPVDAARDGRPTAFGDRVAFGSARRPAHLRRAARPGRAAPRRWASRAGRRAGRPRRRQLRRRADPRCSGARSPACRSCRSTTAWPTTSCAAILARTAPAVAWSSTTRSPRGRRDRRCRAGRASAEFLAELDGTPPLRRRPMTRSIPTTSPSCCSRAAPPASPRPRCCATGTSRRTSSAPSSSWAPTRTRPRW